ncbi:hypothetical protein EV682_101557 [Iodobacter fluviatilis]|uniref:Uncharacterized protein n=2 Tax=Iodobacter fluviatilis TaxID=537 RepID=A0A377Q4A8_9NEIS|nr:hypothetical protein EV682_101557 [Iodobacter fluviatilis]STQ89550.1 Uncharacterised protein [Iodobacter fluviatilis]
MWTWHQLDLCLYHHKLSKKTVRQAKKTISETYPKLSQEIGLGSELSLSAKELINALPYDFSHGQNAGVLNGMCQLSPRAAEGFIKPDWQKELSCWQ